MAPGSVTNHLARTVASAVGLPEMWRHAMDEV
jgi:hypothetical protein